MDQFQEKAFKLIEEQQKGIENTAPWMVGEQLKDICRAEPSNAEIIAQDLTVAEMSLASAEEKIKAWADSQRKKGNSFCVPPNVAEGILREFYGLCKTERKDEMSAPNTKHSAGKVIDIMDFL